MGTNQGLCLLVLLAAVTVPLYGQRTGRTALAVEVRPECGVNLVTQAPGAGGSETIAFQYKLRTSAANGKGQIVLRLSGASTGMVEYRATLAGPGIPMAGRVEGGKGEIAIAEFGPEAHTSRTGATGTVVIKTEGTSGGLRPVLAISCQ